MHTVTSYAQLVSRIEESQNNGDPEFKELKEYLRAGSGWVGCAADDSEMQKALRAENSALAALIAHILQIDAPA